MRKTIFISLFVLALLHGFTASIAADDRVMTESASLVLKEDGEKLDLRAVRLKRYLKSHNSPLSDYSHEFVKYADEYGLDYRLVPAIAGVESTFGKRIPANSFNAYGWANGKYYFESWEHSIEVVSKTLREKYYDRGADTLPKIARRYAPPSKSWSWKVTYFMDKIDPLPVEFDL